MPASCQGVNRESYLVVPRTLIFITCGNKVLLLKGAPGKRLWSNLYNGVGGHVERGEGVISAAQRELWEETGIDCSDLWLCGTITIDAQDDIGVLVFVLRGESAGGTIVPSKEGSLRWVDRDEILNLPLVEDLHVILPEILSKTPDDKPFFAHYTYDEMDKLEISFDGNSPGELNQQNNIGNQERE